MQALAPILPAEEMQRHLDGFDDVYFAAFASRMRAKLGLKTVSLADDQLLESLLDTMEATGADWTVTFRALCSVPLPPHTGGNDADGDYEKNALASTVGEIVECCATPQQQAAAAMQRSLELGAASAEPEDAERSEALRRRAEGLGMMPAPFKQAHDASRWSAWIRSYVQRLGAENVQRGGAEEAARRDGMRAVNPRVVLRNWIAQEAIEAAERGDYEEVRRVIDVVTHPYDEPRDGDAQAQRYALPQATIEGRCLS